MAEDESPIPPAVDLRACPTCQSAEVIVPESFSRPLMSTDRDQIVNWPNLTTSTQHKHRTKAQRAFYKVAAQVPKIDCSLGHHHRRGQVVETLCGITILLGWKCAANALSDYEETMALRSAAESYFLKLAKVRRVPGDLLDKLKVLVPYIARADEYRTAHWSTPFGREMRRRADSGLPRDAEVTFYAKQLAAIKATDLGDMRERDGSHTIKIKGLPFWNAYLGIHGANATLQRATALVADVIKLDEQDHDALENLHQRTKSLELSTEEIEPMYNLCRLFLGADNLRVAAAAVSQAA